MSITNIYANPGKLLIPDASFMELLACGSAFSKNGSDLVGKYDGFSMVKGSTNMEQAVNDACSQTVIEQDSIRVENDCFSLIGKAVPATLLEDYKHATIDGKKCTLWEGLEAVNSNKGKVEFVKLSEEEKERVGELINHALLDQPAMIAAGDRLREFGKELQSTDHWYNWNNTKEFKDILTALNGLPTDRDEYSNMDKFAKHFKSIQNLAQEYVDKRDGKSLNANGVARLNICKNILEFTKTSLADDFFHNIVPNPEPGMTRTKIDLTNEIQDSVEEYEDILDNQLDKTICFEKGSQEEQEFYME